MASEKTRRIGVTFPLWLLKDLDELSLPASEAG
jgi:hypothetical protein